MCASMLIDCGLHQLVHEVAASAARSSCCAGLCACARARLRVHDVAHAAGHRGRGAARRHRAGRCGGRAHVVDRQQRRLRGRAAAHLACTC